MRKMDDTEVIQNCINRSEPIAIGVWNVARPIQIPLGGFVEGSAAAANDKITELFKRDPVD